jgi:hypothetical protein
MTKPKCLLSEEIELEIFLKNIFLPSVDIWKHSLSQFIFTDQSVVHLGLMIILVVGGVIGCALTAWWFIPSLRKRLPGL